MTKGKKAAPAPKPPKKVEIQAEQRPTIPVSSPSTTSSKTSDSLTPTNISVQEEDDGGRDIFDLIYGSDVDSGEEEEALETELEYLQRKTLEQHADFFNTFGGVPSMDDISLDLSAKLSTVSETKKRSKSEAKDVGRFVNPITGEVLDDDGETSEEEEEEESETEEEPLDISELSELSLPDYASDVEEPDEKSTEDALEIFLELEKEPVMLDTTEIDLEAWLLEEEHQRLVTTTLDFITDIINKVVEIMEYVSPEKFLAQNLDKRKLLLEISNILPILHSERRASEFLNRQVATHFRHRSSYNSMRSSSAKNMEQDKQKYDRAREHLDKVLAEEAKLSNSSTGLLEELRQQHKSLKKHVANLVDNFEHLVRKNLCRDNRPKLNMEIEDYLMIMRSFRKEINTSRFGMLLHQHTEAHLMQILAQLEDLGNGLTVKDFNNLQAETQALDKKIEERNNELNKLHARCRSDLHAYSHYKEKQQMAADSIVVQKINLSELLRKKRKLRVYVFNLKKERTQLSGEIKRLSAQCGILDKPALMLDYDETVERCKEQQTINDYLKRTLAGIERKLQNLLEQDDCQDKM